MKWTKTRQLWRPGLILALILQFISLANAGEVYREDFEQGADGRGLDTTGWIVQAGTNQSIWEIKNKKLKITCKRAPYDGGLAERKVPLLKKGTLDFDLFIGADNTVSSGPALTVELYNLSLWFHLHLQDVRTYFPAPPSRKMPGYDIEPVGHKMVGKFTPGEWHHYRIGFDAARGMVEYYCDDLENPFYVDWDAPVWGRDQYQGGHLRLVNMGLLKEYPVVYEMDNIVLTDLSKPDGAPDTMKKDPRRVMVVEGFSSARYQLDAMLDKLQAAKADHYYVVTKDNSQSPSSNRLRLEKFPGSKIMKQAGVMILADVPGPMGGGQAEVLPAPFCSAIAEWVEEGGHLVILGGFFTLSNGGFQESPLAPLLPVELKGIWRELTNDGKPLVLGPNADALKGLDWSENPALWWYHDLTPRPGSTVFLKAGGKPLFITGKHGAGTISVFAGAAYGYQKGQEKLFWQWKDWPELLALTIKSAISTGGKNN